MNILVYICTNQIYIKCPTQSLYKKSFTIMLRRNLLNSFNIKAYCKNNVNISIFTFI